MNVDVKLFNASLHGDMEGVVAALAQGGRVGHRSSPSGATPLLAAAQSGHTDICRILLAQGSSVHDQDRKGFTPLQAAAQNSHTDTCDLLLAHGSDLNQLMPGSMITVLQHAALHGNVALVETLLSWGAAADLQIQSERNPLYGACQGGHLPCVRALFKAGASLSLPNIAGDLPIHGAVSRNKVEIVRFLLEVGCSPNMVRR